MKNLTTPRTLADCNFAVGYAIHHTPRRASPWASLACAVVLFASLAACGAMIAWRA
jgi:hypothetical protein